MKPWLKTVIGLTLGVITGLILTKLQTIFSLDLETMLFYKILVLSGNAFIDLLKMIVGLIIFASIVSGVCHIKEPKTLGRIGLRTLIFYLVSTVVAIGIGIVVVYAMKPGVGLDLEMMNMGAVEATHSSPMELLFEMIPSNPFASFAQGKILQIVVFALFFAMALIFSGEKGKRVLHYFESLSAILAHLAHLIMKLAPIGVFALMATSVVTAGSRVILPLLYVVLAIFISCFLQIAIVFCGALKYLAKVRIAPFFKGMKDAIAIAISTSSSAATLPVSLECVRDHLGVSGDISGFVMSLGSTINMNGTAITQAIFAIFIAQAYQIEMTAFSLVILAVTSLVASIGTAGVPGSGVMTLTIVLSALGLPLEGIALVFAVDRLRDMMATVVNILGDAVASVFVAKKEGQIDEKLYHSVTWTE